MIGMRQPARLRLVRGGLRSPAREFKLPRGPSPDPTRPLRVLGIDPGTLKLGYGVVEVWRGGRLRYVECGVLCAPASRTRAERLGIIGQHLRALVQELGPDTVALERAFYGRNVQSTLALGEARGVVLFVAVDAGLEVTGYAPATVKQAVVGNGRAGKDQVATLVRALLDMRRKPEPDAADALAIAICHGRAIASVRAR